MKIGDRIWVRGDELARFDILKRKMGFFDERDEPITMYEFERITHDGEVLETYIKNREDVEI